MLSSAYMLYSLSWRSPMEHVRAECREDSNSEWQEDTVKPWHPSMGGLLAICKVSIRGVSQSSMESTSHLWSLPTICGFYQPPVGSISYLWSLPIICEPYQLFVGSTRHLWVLSVIYRAYQSSVGSTSHLCGLPASHLCGLPVICMVYQSSVWSICHLWDLSAICGVYQPPVRSTSHLWYWLLVRSSHTCKVTRTIHQSISSVL